MSRIRLERITKTFKEVRAVDDVTLTIEPGEFMVLLGPSGCGKTTTLRMIAGLESITSGTLSIDGAEQEAVAEPALAPPPRRLTRRRQASPDRREGFCHAPGSRPGARIG